MGPEMIHFIDFFVNLPRKIRGKSLCCEVSNLLLP
jgi:hypothetical protein